MGSQETWLPAVKKDPHLRRSSNSPLRIPEASDDARGQSVPRNRSRLSRLLLSQRIPFWELFCCGVVFFVVLVLSHCFVPRLLMEDGRSLNGTSILFEDDYGWLPFLKELDFGDDVGFENLSVGAKFRKDDKEEYESVAARKLTRFGYKEPIIALVFADLLVDPYQIQMFTIATALHEIGYEFEVLSLDDGPTNIVWRDAGFPLRVIRADDGINFNVDWLNYNVIVANSLKAVGVLYSLMQEPFKIVPLVWNIQEQELAEQLRHYVSTNQSELVNNWRKVFSRATSIVFPNYILPMAYSICDPGNFVVIPGSPAEAWKVDNLLAAYEFNPDIKLSYEPDECVVTIVGSQMQYNGQWLEHALVLQALYPVFQDFSRSKSHLRIIILAGDSKSNYHHVVETIALNLKYPNETVKHVAFEEDSDIYISAADLVIYGSFLDEPIFPGILIKAMCLEVPIIAPNLQMIEKVVSTGVNGYIFPRDDIEALTDIVFQLVPTGRDHASVNIVTSSARRTAENLMVSESVKGYALLLENIATLPSEVSLSRTAYEISSELEDEWQWRQFEGIRDAGFPDQPGWIHSVLVEVEKQFNHTQKGLVKHTYVFEYSIWEEQKYIDIAALKERKEEEELKARSDRPVGILDDLYKIIRRPNHSFRERDDGELERTGQPLCIYEPYFGQGTWPFLHHSSLYRGIGLSRGGHRPGVDDIDAPSRLPLLNDSYYRDILGEHGAFFAVADRIDNVHKNAWIGFQSWRGTARKKSLSRSAERSLLNAIEGRRHGDTLYFWVRLDMDPRNQLRQDFWSFCDAVNAGNCQYVFLEALKYMYDIKHNMSSLPAMPAHKGTWSVMHSWALPTKSFLEFVMFSRMFVDALDAKFYDVHHKTGLCCLSLSEDRHCYSRLLELLINVWAYHSARRMVYIDPRTGYMHEQHKLDTRKGLMWIKWFEFSLLKTMDEDLAEEFDTENPKRRWLWPSTGEVLWEGIIEREKELRDKEKERKKQKNKERIKRIKKRTHQKALGKYVKPEDTDSSSNSTASEANLPR